MRPRPLAAGLGLVCAVAGLVGITRPSLWLDEAASLSVVERPLPDALALLGRVDAVHALYYAFLKVWTEVLGTSPLAIRSLSALFLGVGCAFLVLLVARWTDLTTAAVAGVLFIALPGLAWSAAEARPAAFSVAAVTGSLLALQVALDLGGRARWLRYGFAVAFAAGVNIMTVLVLPVHALLVWRARRREGRRVALPWFLSAGAAGLACLPLLVLAVRQRGQVSWIDENARTAAVKVFQQQLFSGPSPHPQRIALTAIVLLAVLTAVLAGVALARRGPSRDQAVVGLLWLVLPTLALTLPILLDVQLYQARYLTFTAPGLCVAAAAGLTALPRRRVVGSVALVAFVGAAVVPLVHLRDSDSKYQARLESMAAYAPGSDAVVFVEPSSRALAYAYPDDFEGTRDVMLVDEAGPSRTIWGTLRPVTDLHGLSGRIVVYYPSTNPALAEVTFDHFKALGCRGDLPVAGDSAASVRVYRCP